MPTAEHDKLIAELAILHEISSFELLESEESIGRSAIEKASRLFGVRYFSWLRENDEGKQIIASWGFKNPADVYEKLQVESPNQFRFAFNTFGQIFMEQSRPLSVRERRLYSIFARQMEKTLMYAKNVAERRQLSLAVEQSPSSIIITDLDSKIEYVNAAFVKATGYSAEEAIGQSPRILSSGNTQNEIYDDMWAHLNRGEVWKGELINRRKDGGEYVESAWISPVRQPDGSVTSYLSINEDITQLKQAETALRSSRENLHLLLNSIAEGAYGLDTRGVCTFVNRAFLQMLGYENEAEVLGMHLHELIHYAHPDGSPYPADECKTCRAYLFNQAMNASDEVFWRKDGVAIPVEYWSHPIVSDGAVIGAIVTFIDITERKRVEKTLENMAAKFHTLFERSSDAIMLLDEKGFFDCNEAALRMFGCTTRDELISRHPAEYSPSRQPGGEDSLTLANEHIATAIKLGSNLFEWTHRRQDGSEFPADVLLNALVLDGKPVLQATVRDITERKHAENALRESEEKFSRIFESNPAMVAIGTLDGTMVDANLSYAGFLGIPREEMLGKSLVDLGVISAEELQRLLELGHRGESLRNVEVLLRARDGKRLNALLSAEIVTLGGVRYRLATLQDITARKQAEARLIEQLDELRRWHDVTSSREGRILELKHEVNELLGQTGKHPRYPSAEPENSTEK